MQKKIWLCGLVLLLSACVIEKNITPVATGGSKADGVVELSFEHGSMEKPIIDEQGALSTAQKRCEAWGYSKTDKFGGYKRQCLQMDSMLGCIRYMVTVQYQCTN